MRHCTVPSVWFSICLPNGESGGCNRPDTIIGIVLYCTVNFERTFRSGGLRKYCSMDVSIDLFQFKPGGALSLKYSIPDILETQPFQHVYSIYSV